MSWEDKYDAMCEYDAEQQSEGRAEALAELRHYFETKYNPKECLPIEEILAVIDLIEGV